MKIQILKNANNKWYWRIVAANGNILAHSEAYSSKAKARKTVRSVARAVRHTFIPIEVMDDQPATGK